MDPEIAPPGIDVTKPHPARRYDYWLGGKDNWEADRESADMVAGAFPTVQFAALENRNFLRRVVTFLAGEAGIRQYLDIGAGLPTVGNVHEIAQDIAPASRIVYVDNDPIVAIHARSLLDSAADGRTAYVEADVRDPEDILSRPEVIETLDFTRPVALILAAVMHFVVDEERPYEKVRRLSDALPSGSYLVMSHATSDHLTEEELVESEEANQRSGIPFQLRSTAEFSRFFDGYELVPPGIGSIMTWRPEGWKAHPRPEAVSMLGAVARIP
ncbi:SAM-dependent methyltransferase [Nocardia terpenica]|uniref:SAM-dependent methyltransferase n=1 Tax=Nocardia terpenica TaxID=455432 RepID=UPI001894B2DF|nr:SAM-dependent methyltransferase [Nocardia terpenica]MBF6059628.1 SAM-dependent methyltransferase [Nocardia terpenica]MBF6102833.1 SAM-dependent methyltransferase [Nocardia terpenica]MBF6110978.1 SAM-dependent methyltransferase [Nocardia terpenica]MBF6117109.1 SAM-dependent methyltransferase [Nocardia terpenica]MBF6151053.1 SAM-dependent methyltransferase [Nocardia terpenica]